MKRNDSMMAVFSRIADDVKNGRKVEYISSEDFKVCENSNYSGYRVALEQLLSVLYIRTKGKRQSAIETRFVTCLDMLGFNADEIDSIKKKMGNYNALLSIKFKPNGNLTASAKQTIAEIKSAHNANIAKLQKSLDELLAVETDEKSAVNHERTILDLQSQILSEREVMTAEIDGIKNSDGAYVAEKFSPFAKGEFKKQFEYVVTCALYDIPMYENMRDVSVDTSSEQWQRKLRQASKFGVEAGFIEQCKNTGNLSALKQAVETAKAKAVSDTMDKTTKASK